MRASSLVHLRSLATVAMLVATPLAAQVGRVVGSVVDAESGQPVDNVQVFLRGTGRGASTQANGRYFILNVQPGQYTVSARRLGYQEQQVTNVTVLIDVSREINFRLSKTSATLAAVRVEAPPTPLIQPGITGSSDAITAAELQSLPVVDVKGALALQAGFLAVPENTDVLSYTDRTRGLEPVRVRGGRPGETLTLIDGIPVNNFLFGGPAIDISTAAVQQIDYVRGGFEPQYGNALSGIINIAVREGTSDLQGTVEVQSSGAGGAIGSRYDELRNYNLVQGFVSGSVPATGNKLRYMVAGKQRSGASRVLEFDNEVYNPRADERDPNNNFNSVYDLFPGFRAIGFDNQRDVTAKASYYFTPLQKLNFTIIDYAKQTQPYSFDWVQTGFDGFAQCSKLYPDLVEQCSSIYNDGKTVTSVDDLQDTNNENWYVRQSSSHQTRRLYAAQLSQTLGRMAITTSLGEFRQERSTCVYLSGVCIGQRLSYTYFQGPFVYTGGRSRNVNSPLFGSEEITGGDEMRTQVGRADVTWQVTDHHNLQGGVFGQRHDVQFAEFRDVGLNKVVLSASAFKAKPWDAALYLQDRVEYDFITVKLGARFDYGRAPGRFFANPNDPTNGTTAREVCNDPSGYGLPANSFEAIDSDGNAVTGFRACAANDSLKTFATGEAALDDFEEAPSRATFSPRIGVQFPLTQASALFFNFGRFAQNPELYDLYRGTGVGLANEGTPDGVQIVQPSGRAPLLGNPQLETEVATSYEIGYATEFLANYAFRATAFNKSQSGLTGVSTGGLLKDGSRVNDPGATYKTNAPNYQVLKNGDFQIARGLELQLKRRLATFWAFDLNYSYSRVTTNAAPPELELQKREEGDPPARTRIRSDIDQPHVFNGTIRLQVGDRIPAVPYAGRFLTRTALTTTLRAASGLPYTPDFGGLRRERNSGTAPTTVNVDLFASKDFTVGNALIGSFVRVSNVFNKRNCQQVFPSTGQCESGNGTTGRLEKARIGASYGSTGTFSQAFDRPDYRVAPRAIIGGLRLTF